MTISPVSAVSFRSYNNINFEGRKNKNSFSENHSGNSSTGRLVLPLAAAISLMPLNITKARSLEDLNAEHTRTELSENIKSDFVEEIKDDGVSIESKKINTKQYGQITVTLKSTDGDNSNFELVEAKFPVYNVNTKTVVPKTLKVIGAQEYGPYRLQSQDDTEEMRNDLIFKTVLMKDESQNDYFCNNKEYIDYIEELRVDPRNNNKAIQKTVVPRYKLRTDYEGAFQFGGYGGSSLKELKPVTTDGMKKVAELEFESENVKYVFRCYSTDGNDDNAEKVTLERISDVKNPGFKEAFVHKVIVPTHVIYPDSDNPTTLATGIVVLKGDGNRQYMINNDKLANILYSTRNDNDIKEAYSIERPTFNYIVKGGSFRNYR
ncbi:MAG: hypothetical protein ACLSWI_04490 [Candidatus Gastranaerophilaceae bacterium]